MLVVMDQRATPEDIQAVVARIENLGMTAKPIPGGTRTSICVLFNKGAVDPGHFAGMAGVLEVIRVSKPFKLVSRETHPEDTRFEVNGVAVGGDSLAVIAGPCAVESLEQMLTAARQVKEAGAVMLRGGAFKPRTSPYSFQGLGIEGSKTLARVREETGLPVV
ncbi:3-deoxy-7-phosphoheptulonate synthase, partial [Candidatus Poribacteria bacterium]|nr:3-deoxy-7-phosphoheptulonate synthase [Candidatus Poribacteria bacterium]